MATTILQRLTAYEMLFMFLFVTFVNITVYNLYHSAMMCTSSGVVPCAFSIRPLITGLIGVVLMLTWNSPHFWGIVVACCGVYVLTIVGLAVYLKAYLNTHEIERDIFVRNRSLGFAY